MKTGSDVVLTGMFRIKIGEEGPDGKTKIVGDSGWVKNTVTNYGFREMIIYGFATQSNSFIQPTHLAIGSVSATDHSATVASDATQLLTEISASTRRQAITTSVINSHTFQALATWASGSSPDGIVGQIGLFGSSGAGGTLQAGQSFAGSSWGTNQALSATYQLRFSTA